MPRRYCVTVIGAGIVGVTTALALREDGHEVEIIDRLPPGEACSFGNSGGMPGSHAFPVGMPGTLRRVPGMLLDRAGPLAVRRSQLASLAPWLLRFAAASRPRHYRPILLHLFALMRASHAEWTTLIDRAGLHDLIREEGALTLFRSEAAREAAWAAWRPLIEQGAELSRLGPDALREREPAAPALYSHALHEPDYRRTSDPWRLTMRLAERFLAQGGRIRRETVSEIVPAADGRLTVRTSHACGETDRLVIAAGAWSRPFAARFGHRVPLQSGRGYHVTFLDVPHPPQHALFLSDLRLSLNPMRNGLRVGGNIEFTAPGAPPDFSRPARLIEALRRVYPALAVEPHTKWAGDRPLLPDSLPIIGGSANHPALVFAFGHGQYGLALAAGTARLIADLLADRPPILDPSPFAIDRFR